MKHVSILLILAAGTCAAQAPSVEQRLAELERKIKLLDPAYVTASERAIEDRLKQLESKIDELLAAVPVAQAGRPVLHTTEGEAQATRPVPLESGPIQAVSVTGDFQKSGDPETRLPVAGYMDFHVNKESGDSFRPDFHRFVLLFGHSFSNRFKFWSELELEHSLLEGGEETGEIALEQAYLDFLITPRFNLRAGMMLTPVGIVNERHEPPSFNGVERPFVESIIIPTTWRELGFGFTGDLGRGFRYRAYLTSALDASRFDAESGIAEGKTAGFDTSMRNPALVARVEYAGRRRLTLGASMYSGLAGFQTPGLNPRVSIASFDGRYSYGRADFRGLFANAWVSRAADLNLQVQQQTGVSPNIARQMRGYYLEPAYHLFPRRYRNDLIAFLRYERYNTQHAMPRGYVPLRQFDRSSWVAGLTFKPVPDIAFKFDYVFNRNASSVVKPVNGLNLGIGWWF